MKQFPIRKPASVYIKNSDEYVGKQMYRLDGEDAEVSLKEKKPDKVLIVGAGPAGLTLGLRLSEAGVPVEIIEADDRVGGLCKTIHFKGCYFDLGGHRFITKDKNIQSFLEKLMGDDLLVRPRKSIICLKDKKIAYPVNAKDIVSKLGLKFSTQAFLDYFLTSTLQRFYPRLDSSFEQWVINRYGVTLYNFYFGPYSKKLWGIKPCQISHRWAEQRILLLNLGDVIAKMLWKKGNSPPTYAHQFCYPKNGIGQIFEKIAEKITVLGGAIRVSSGLSKVKVSGDKIISISYRTSGGAIKETSGDYIINTAPLPSFINMLSCNDNGNNEEITENSHYRSIRFMNVCLDLPSITDNTWIYVPESEIVFFRIQELRNWSPTVVPEGKTALTLEIACDYNDKIWKMPEDELWQLCYRGLVRLGLLKSNNVLWYFSSYARHAYPIYYLDYEKNVNKMYFYISKIKNLRCIGRQGLFRYNNMDHSIKMGLLTAEHILNGYPFSEVMKIATEHAIFDWQDPGK